MFKTLGALAVAMTATTGVLGWIDPSSPLPDDVPSAEELLPFVREVVADGVSIRSGRWTNVEVLTREDRRSRGIMLAASASAVDFHFAIDESGRLSRSAAWRSQSSLNRAPDTVCIRLRGVPASVSPTDIQINTARALVLALREVAEAVHTPLAIHVDRG